MPPIRNFHVPLPDPLYRRLRDAAKRTSQPATTLARYAIDHWLRQQQRSMVREAIATYAAAVAGTRDDLDEALESAALELWRNENERPVRRTRKRKR